LLNARIMEAMENINRELLDDEGINVGTLLRTTKIYVVVIEDHEGCGTIVSSVHMSLAGATAALRTMVEDEFRMAPGSLSHLDADQIEELVDTDEGKTAKVEEKVLLP
jgi:hypothetical protein